MPLPTSPLFADIDIGALIKLAVFAVVAIVWAINKMMGAAGQGGRRPPLPRNQPPFQAPGAPAPQRPAGGVEQEIEAFLRRAAQARSGQPAQPPAASRPQARPQPSRPPVRPAPATALREQPVDVEIVDEAPMGAGVEQHVKRHLDISNFSQRAENLGKVDEAVEEIVEHVHEKFDHKVGQLSRAGGASVAPQSTSQPAAGTVPIPATSAAGFAALLANANNLRQAIVLNEVLRRPEHNW